MIFSQLPSSDSSPQLHQLHQLHHRQQHQPPSPRYSYTASHRPLFDTNNSYHQNFSFPYNQQSSNNHLQLQIQPELMPQLDHELNWNYAHSPLTNHATASNHQRASSNSSAASTTGPATPYNDHTSPAVSEYSFDGLPNCNQNYNIYQKSLPTPTSTPLRDSYSLSEYQTYPRTIEAETIMALQQQYKNDDLAVQSEYSHRPSTITRHESSSEDVESRRKTSECFVFSCPLGSSKIVM